MWTLIASLASSAFSSASGILITLGVVAGIFIGGMAEQHKIDANALTSLKAQYAAASAEALAKGAAIQQANDNRAIAAATAEAAVQTQLATALQQELFNVKTHVVVKSITANCVPLGLVRVLYAGSHGVDANSLPLGAGQSDDTCSPIGWPELAAAIVHDYGQARANGEQLTALQALVAKGAKVK